MLRHNSRERGEESGPRVLLIAYYYPPCRESGSVRPFGLNKYLPRFGWETLVLTPRLERSSTSGIIETGYKDVLSEWKRRFRLDPNQGLHDQLKLSASTTPNARPLHRRAIDRAKWILSYPDPLKGWYPCAVEELEKLRGSARIDAIISTGPPLVAHIIGAQAKRIFGVPWIADFRDLWNIDDRTFDDRRGVIGAIQARTERKLLAGADALVTVSDPWAGQLRRRYPEKLVEAITNGYDPDEVQVHERPTTRKFSITHTGILYEGLRDPSTLMQVLRELVDAGQIDESDLLLRFYGPVEPFLPPTVTRYGLEKVTELAGSVPRSQALEFQRESQLLLLLSWSSPDQPNSAESGVHTGKVFEYLAARRPILAVGGVRGVLTELLEETGAGVHAMSKEQLRNAVLDSYRKFKEQGRVPYDGNSAATDRYSHLHMAKRFGLLLDGFGVRQKQVEETLAATPEEQSC